MKKIIPAFLAASALMVSTVSAETIPALLGDVPLYTTVKEGNYLLTRAAERVRNPNRGSYDIKKGPVTIGTLQADCLSKELSVTILYKSKKDRVDIFSTYKDSAGKTEIDAVTIWEEEDETPSIANYHIPPLLALALEIKKPINLVCDGSTVKPTKEITETIIAKIGLLGNQP